MSQTTAANMTLNAQAQRTLASVAALMIPPSAEYRVPGADDPVIIADMLRSLGRDGPLVNAALARLDSLAGGPFAELPVVRQEEVAALFRAEATPELATLSRVILQCYYRDDRVMISLNMEPRPPFPKGHVLEQGDWSLLDPVRKRAKMWRDAP